MRCQTIWVLVTLVLASSPTVVYGALTLPRDPSKTMQLRTARLGGATNTTTTDEDYFTTHLSNAQRAQYGMPPMSPRHIRPDRTVHRRAAASATYTALPTKDGGYTTTCTGEATDGSTSVTATCLMDDGVTKKAATVTISNCFVNSNAVLGCQKGGLAATSCSKCTMSTAGQFCCTCKNSAGTGKSTCIDSNTCLANSNGTLVCF